MNENRSNIFLVLDVYNYVGLKGGKKNRGRGFKRYMEKMGFSILRSISK